MAAPPAICATAAGKFFKIPQSREGPSTERGKLAARPKHHARASRHADISWAFKAAGDAFQGPTPGRRTAPR
ncbi:hypothetical protein CN163_33145 [Sinorhizobium meliloti]|nr:hypothetical protein CN163_33145 [Sinorhizobium meliloti]